MLGGLLSRQAEEEERRLREEGERNGDGGVPPGEAGAPRGGGSTPTGAAPRAGDDGESERYAAAAYGGVEDDDDDGWTGGYGYSDRESDGDFDDDGDGGCSSSSDDGDGNEESYLLRGQPRRRRNRRGGDWSGLTLRSFGRVARRAGRKLRAAVVAIADVDDVWDSPDAPSPSVRRRRGDSREAGATDGSDFGGPGRGSVIYHAITGGTTSSRNNRTAAVFWFVFLSTSYASERSTFKLLVDRVGPFRLFSAELILGAHAALLGAGMLAGRFCGGKSEGVGVGCGGVTPEWGHSGGWSGLPLADVGLMAVLDTFYLLLGVISGSHVPPVLTVILVQTTIPLTACFTQCVHPDGRCNPNRGSFSGDEHVSSPNGNSSTAAASHSNHNSSVAAAASHSNVRIISSSTLNEMQSATDVLSYPDISSIPNLPAPPPPPVRGWGGLSRHHIIGTGLMFLAVLLGLTPAILSLNQIYITKEDAMPERTAYNTVMFCLATVPAAMSQLYKEHTLRRLRRPIDRKALNLALSVLQLLFAVVVSPLAYGLQGMGDGPGWTTLYPSKSTGENFSHGMACFIGKLDEDTMRNGYPEVARCDYAWLLVSLHVVSIISVGIAIDKLAAATKVMYRGVSFGIMLGVVFMFVYQLRDQWCEYGPLVSSFHLTSTAVLIVGAEIYHRVSLADATFETAYPEIGDLYYDEE